MNIGKVFFERGSGGLGGKNRISYHFGSGKYGLSSRAMEEKELTAQIIRNFYKVYNGLGHGFLESVYRNAMTLELVSDGLVVEVERSIAVHYNGRVVGTFAADLVVANRVIVELKAKEKLAEAHEAQLTNYLRATEIEIGLLFNFGRSPEFKRRFFSNSHKNLSGSGNDLEVLDSLFVSDPFESA